MRAFFLGGVLLIIPVLVAGVLHMVAVKLDWLRALARPVHEPLFGRNKTWRGFVVMPLAGGLGVALAVGVERLWEPGLPVRLGDQRWLLLGLALGLAYVAFELPNSYFKRRMGVAPGALPGRHRWAFFALDHLDSLIGCVLVYALFLGGLSTPLLGALMLGPAVHVAVNLGLFAAGVRKRAF